MTQLIIDLMPGVLALFMCAAIILPRRLIRGKKLAWKDFYIGVDLCWASVSSGLVSLFNAIRIDLGLRSVDHGNLVRLLYVVIFLALTIVFLFVDINIHQRWETRGHLRFRRILLAGVSNFIGLTLFLVSIFVFEGVS